jgi:hypothetical protein
MTSFPVGGNPAVDTTFSVGAVATVASAMFVGAGPPFTREQIVALMSPTAGVMTIELPVVTMPRRVGAAAGVAMVIWMASAADPVAFETNSNPSPADVLGASSMAGDGAMREAISSESEVWPRQSTGSDCQPEVRPKLPTAAVKPETPLNEP